MIRSMTGYARLESQNDEGRIVWEMRAVNHRYLDLSFKLPDDFRVLEADIRAAVAPAISRGKVEISLRYAREGAAASTLNIDRARLDEVQQALDVVGAQLGASAVPDPLRILQFPGVVRAEQPDFTALIDLARDGLGALLKDFNATREREGERLGAFLTERAEALQAAAHAVRERYPQVRDSWLEAHLAELRKVIKRREAVGRRLDFLMQELNREANTLSSKSQDAEMTRHGVDMKVLIEQMREQVQNIE